MAAPFYIPSNSAQGVPVELKDLTEVLKGLLNCFSRGECHRSERMGDCPLGVVGHLWTGPGKFRGKKENQQDWEKSGNNSSKDNSLRETVHDYYITSVQTLECQGFKATHENTTREPSSLFHIPHTFSQEHPNVEGLGGCEQRVYKGSTFRIDETMNKIVNP